MNITGIGLVLTTGLILGLVSLPISANNESSGKTDGEEVWIVTEQTSVSAIKTAMNAVDVSMENVSKAESFSIFKLNSPQVSQLANTLHKTHHRCGGFTSHTSLEEAELALVQTLASQATNLLATSYSINNGVNVSPMVAAVSNANIAATIGHLSTAYPNRYYQTDAGLSSAQWIYQQWSNLALERADINVEYYQHSAWKQPSIILTINGDDFPDEVVVLGAHIDSTVGAVGENTFAPGADDDASGVAVLTEALRVLVAEDYRPQRTIKIMGYAAEEVGLRGSDAIAKDFKAQNTNVVGVLQLDMTNFNGSAADITIFTDYTNSAQNSFIADLIATYQNIQVGYSQCGYGCSDHASWHRQGYPTSMPFETSMSEINPHIHTGSDTLANSDATANTSVPFAKLALSYMGELAKGRLGNNPKPDIPKNEIQEFSGQVGRNIEQQLGYIRAKPGSNVSISMTGTQDADLYVNIGSEPTTNNWTCRPYKNGSSESCSVAVPDAGGDVYIMVRGYSSQTSTYQITASYMPVAE